MALFLVVSTNFFNDAGASWNFWEMVHHFLTALAGISLMFFVPYFWLKQYDGQISFSERGIGDRPKSLPIPYAYYRKAVLSRIDFEGQTLQIITFHPKNTWFHTRTECGFTGDEDLSGLLNLLKSKSLPVEDEQGFPIKAPLS